GPAQADANGRRSCFGQQLAVVVFTIHSDRVEEKSVIFGAAITKEFAVHKILRNRAEELGHEFRQRIRITAIREMKALNGNRSDQRTAPRFGFGDSSEQGQALTLKAAINTGSHGSQGFDAEDGVAGPSGAGVGGAGESAQFEP